MKFVCLGCLDVDLWAKLTEAEQSALMEECMQFDDEIRRNGNWIGGEALQGVANAVTLRLQNGKPIATDGPYVETKEQLGGILFLEARDLNHAIAIMSRHPGLRIGPFEIRPSHDEMNRLILDRTAAIEAEQSSS